MFSFNILPAMKCLTHKQFKRYAKSDRRIVTTCVKKCGMGEIICMGQIILCVDVLTELFLKHLNDI